MQTNAQTDLYMGQAHIQAHIPYGCIWARARAPSPTSWARAQARALCYQLVFLTESVAHFFYILEIVCVSVFVSIIFVGPL